MELGLSRVFCDYKTKISSEYEWELGDCFSGGCFPVFTAKRKDSDKEYHCMLISKQNEKERLELFKDCEKYSSMIEIEEVVSTNNIIYVFYEAGQPLSGNIKIDDKMLIKMFIELNEINLSRDIDIIVYYSYEDIVLKDDKYKMRHSSIFRKSSNIRTDFALIKAMLKVFACFNLNVTEIKEIYYCIVGMANLDEKEMRIGYLNKKLRKLVV